VSQFTLLQKRAFVSIAAAIGAHVFVFAFWVLLIIWDLPIFAIGPPDAETLPLEEPEVMVMIRPFVPSLPPVPPPKPPQVAEAPKPEVLEPAQPPLTKPSVVKAPEAEQPIERKSLPEQKRQFARTSADQEGEPDPATDVLGERDTRAASELPPTQGADPNLPSQDGADPLHRGHVETVEKKHEDGSVGMDKAGQETETPQDATAARKDNDLIDVAPKVDSPQPDTAQSARPKIKHIEEGTLLPSSDGGEGKVTIDDKPNAEESPKQKPNDGSKTKGKGEEIEQDLKKDGFKGHSRKTRITGSISRRGKSALNVKNSPLGRYQALVSKAVELQWRRNCEQHRDHIVPGVISLRFYIDKNGKVSGIKFQEVVGANYIEQGFTQRAIRQAKLPKMRRDVLKELDGDPLELIYNFYF